MYTPITRLSVDICHYLTARGLPLSSQKNSSGCNLHSALYTGENCQTSLAEPHQEPPCRAMQDSSGQCILLHTDHPYLFSVPAASSGNGSSQLNAVSSGPQKAPEQSKCDQKRVTVLLGKDCPSSSNGRLSTALSSIPFWKQCHG